MRTQIAFCIVLSCLLFTSLLAGQISTTSAGSVPRPADATAVAVRPASEYSYSWLSYLPLVFKASGQGSAPYRVNVPYFDGDVVFSETAIFWFGQVTQTDNYADVRVGYNSDHLYVRLAAFDRRLWYDTTPSPDDLTAWDAVTLYLDPGGDDLRTYSQCSGCALSPAERADYGYGYRFVGQFNWWEARDSFQAAYRGDDSGWVLADVPFTTTIGWRGDAPNNDSDDRGWAIIFRIPFTSLGLSGAPAQGTSWRIGMAMHDRDDVAGPPAADKTWPDAMAPDSSATWGQLAFGLPSYTAPPSAPGGTVTVRHKLDGETVMDGAVGGGSICGAGLDFWTEWGQTNYASERNFNVQNQSDVADWPCFSKYYVTFPLESVPPNKVILSATLTLHQIGSAGSSGEAKSSLIQVLTVAEDWDEATLTWNNAPLAAENVSQAWVDPITFPGWPGVVREWDVSRAVAEAYAAGESVKLVLYESDSAYHSGKYFVSSDTGDWNAEGRPTLTVVWGQ